jgi:hypothetical protein
MTVMIEIRPFNCNEQVHTAGGPDSLFSVDTVALGESACGYALGAATATLPGVPSAVHSMGRAACRWPVDRLQCWICIVISQRRWRMGGGRGSCRTLGQKLSGRQPERCRWPGEHQ